MECSNRGDTIPSDYTQPDTETRPDGAQPERATSHHLDPRRDGHVWSDLGAQMPGAEVNGRGFGGGAPNSAAAEGGEHLFLTNSRLMETRPRDRGRHCGRFTVRDKRDNRFHRVYCKTWGCGWCGPRKAQRIKWAICNTAEAHGLNRMVSLTLDPKRLRGEPSVPYLNDTFAKLRTYLSRKFKVPIKYIRVLEFQVNGTAHFHLLLDRFIPHAWLQHAWQSVGGGRQVNIKQVDIHRVSHYLAKYLTKELLLSAPKRARRVTTSRAIHLIEKKSKDPSWEFFKLPIEAIVQTCLHGVVEVEFDESGALKSFRELSEQFREDFT